MNTASIRTEADLDLLLSEPSEEVGRALATLSSPLLVLGASGKMGPTLALLAKRSLELVGSDVAVIAVARFSEKGSREWFEQRGIATLACDLMEREQVEDLPDSENVVYMAGRKFGTTGNPSLTWAMNVIPPENVCERYPGSRIVALSTGSVYPMVPVSGGGSVEEDPLTPPGEYANACIARERIFEYFSQKNGMPVCLIRLNYAVELRYGVLVDIASKVLRREPIDVAMGHLNFIWQRDANAMTLRAFALAASPAVPLNLTGPDTHSIRNLAEEFGRRFGIEPILVGAESETALLNNASKAFATFGKPEMSVERIIDLTADWLRSGGRILGKPTHYEVRDGAY